MRFVFDPLDFEMEALRRLADLCRFTRAYSAIDLIQKRFFELETRKMYGTGKTLETWSTPNANH